MTCTTPDGAFYVYPNLSAYIGKGGIKNSMEMASRMLSEAHVVTVPGEAFGTREHIRISYPVTQGEPSMKARGGWASSLRG